MNADKLRQLAEAASRVAEAIQPHHPDAQENLGCEGIDGETWVEANWLADELAQAELDALSTEIAAAVNR